MHSIRQKDDGLVVDSALLSPLPLLNTTLAGNVETGKLLI